MALVGVYDVFCVDKPETKEYSRIMKLELKAMGFKPTPALRKAIEADAKVEQRRVGDIIRLRLLACYGLGVKRSIP